MKIHNAFALGLLGGLGVIVAIGIGAAIGALATIITYVGAAIFLALGIDPIVRRLEARGFKRAMAIVIVLGVLLLVFAGLLWAIIPVIVEQVRKLIESIPDVITALDQGTFVVIAKQTFPWLDVDTIVADIGKWIETLDVAAIGGGVLQAGIGIASGAFGAVIVVILMIYFVASLGSIKRETVRLVPASKRERFVDLSDQISTAVGRYVVGQVLLALVNGILSFIFLTFIVQVQYSALLACIAFIGSLIPLVGTISGSAVITLFVLLLNEGPAWWIVGIYYLVYMQIEAYVLSPRIMAQAVKVPGVIVVIAALSGGTLLGVLGALVAIPVAASVIIIMNQVVIPRQNER